MKDVCSGPLASMPAHADERSMIDEEPNQAITDAETIQTTTDGRTPSNLSECVLASSESVGTLKTIEDLKTDLAPEDLMRRGGRKYFALVKEFNNMSGHRCPKIRDTTAAMFDAWRDELEGTELLTCSNMPASTASATEATVTVVNGAKEVSVCGPLIALVYTLYAPEQVGSLQDYIAQHAGMYREAFKETCQR